MELNLADVQRIKFQKRLKTFLIQKSLGQLSSSYFRMTRSAKSHLRGRIVAFEEGTRQLMLRSKIHDLVSMVLELGNEKDVRFYAENADDVNMLVNAPDTTFKVIIPILLQRTENLHYLANRIVKNSDNISELYDKVKMTHREMLSEILDEERCPLMIFVDILNSMTANDKDINLNYTAIRKIRDLLCNKDIVISWSGGINANRETSAT